MRIIRTAKELGRSNRKVCLAIGFFDGVHLGHQQIIRQTIADARQYETTSVVVTFDRHPNTVVAPERVPPLIYSLPQKLRVIETIGADTLLLIPFERQFSQIEGEEFIRHLAADFGGIQTICVGANFSFGYRRAGNVALLRNLGRELGFSVHGMAAVSLDDDAVSSTRIRDAIRQGKLDLAGQMLGRAYSLVAPVVPGSGLGRELGFPTANLNTAGLVLPPNGVYMVHVGRGGRTHRGVLNIGTRPTFDRPGTTVHVETHLLDFDEDLYGAEVEVFFVEKLREERRFASVNELKEQIARDIQIARSRF